MPREPRMKIECDHTKSGKICSCDSSFNIHCPSCDTKPMKPSERIKKIYSWVMKEATGSFKEDDPIMVFALMEAIGRHLDEEYEKEEECHKSCCKCTDLNCKKRHCDRYTPADKHVFEEEPCMCPPCRRMRIEAGKRNLAEKSVLERNALIDELIDEVDEMDANAEYLIKEYYPIGWHSAIVVFKSILKSKKK